MTGVFPTFMKLINEEILKGLGQTEGEMVGGREVWGKKTKN